jgi:hypothetical protein
MLIWTKRFNFIYPSIFFGFLIGNFIFSGKL